jgi:hypothetical protein
MSETIDLSKEKNFFETRGGVSNGRRAGVVNTRSTNGRCCPVCGHANECRIANGYLYKGACWCEQANVPTNVLRFLAESQLEPACLCFRCLVALAHHARNLDEPAQILARVRQEIPALSRPADFYLDDLGRMVFTADYHLRRGFCCGNGCRHCPYPISPLNEGSV